METPGVSPSSVSPAQPSEIAPLLRELEESGLSVARFAREHGVKSWRLYEARRKARGKERRRRSARCEKSAFARVELSRVVTSADPLELVLSSGHRIRVPNGFDETALRRLMGVLVSC